MPLAAGCVEEDADSEASLRGTYCMALSNGRDKSASKDGKFSAFDSSFLQRNKSSCRLVSDSGLMAGG